MPVYKRAWNLYSLFLSTIFGTAVVSLPISATMLALFIAFLFDRNYAPSTVNTYVSSLGYSHKLYNLPNPARVFFVAQMLKGYSKVGFRLDSRLPITLPILHKLIVAFDSVTRTPYEAALYKAMVSLAFHAFLRVGEMTTRPGSHDGLSLQLHQLTEMVDSTRTVVAFKLTFLHYKHSYNQPAFSIIIHRCDSFCPVQILLKFLQTRGTAPGPLFISGNGLAISRDNFCQYLHRALVHCKLDSSRYKGHSFRIGAASHAAAQGLSDSQIRILGRWKSNAFLRYIRVNSFSAPTE